MKRLMSKHHRLINISLLTLSILCLLSFTTLNVLYPDCNLKSESFVKTAYAVERGSEDRTADVSVNIITIYDIVLVDESGDIQIGASSGWATAEAAITSNNAHAFLPAYIAEGKGTCRNISLPEGDEEFFTVGDGAYKHYLQHRWQSPIARIIAKKLLDEGYLDHCRAAVVYLPSQFGLHFPHPEEKGRPYATHIDHKLVIFASSMSKLDMIGSYLYHADIISKPNLKHEHNDDVRELQELIKKNAGK